MLNLGEVERQLRLLQRQAGIKSIRSNLSRLGSDPTQAVLTVNVEQGRQPSRATSPCVTTAPAAPARAGPWPPW